MSKQYLDELLRPLGKLGLACRGLWREDQRSAWIKAEEVQIEEEMIVAYKVTMMVTFALEITV